MTTENNSVVIDLETNCKAPEPFDRASPHWPENKVVLSCLQKGFNPPIFSDVCSLPVSMVIGQNIKFDFIHMFKIKRPDETHMFFEYAAKNNVAIWDTQVAEYILTGQEAKYASLDELADKYGGSIKDDKIKEYWASGMDTADIPRAELEAYAQEDVLNTRLVSTKQMEHALETGQVPLILSACSATACLAHMAHNGMAVDMDMIERSRMALAIAISEVEAEIHTYLVEQKLDHVLKNLKSNDQLRTLLFGGTIKNKVRVEVGKYKNGNPKFETQERVEIVEPKVTKLAIEKVDKTVDEENLTKLSALISGSPTGLISGTPTGKFITNILKHRKLNKILNTYIQNLIDLRYPDRRIHGTIDQVGTSTGRLNSSKPNMQNYPSGEEDIIKQCFVSRWGADGILLEADYKQLEVVCLAYLTRDAQLMGDIRDGVDIHAAVGEHVFGKHMTKEQRRVVKTVNFGLIYGGGAKTIASQSGQPVELVQTIIDTFHARYPGVRIWATLNQEQVKKAAAPSGKISKLGFPIKSGCLKSETGRIYTFYEKDSPHWLAKKGTSFSPTEIKNYPVQGLATGDIVPMMLGELWRALYADDDLRTKCLMINTVHDSILFDIHKDVYEQAVTKIRGVLDNTAGYYKAHFGKDFDLPLLVEYTAGANWKDLTVID